MANAKVTALAGGTDNTVIPNVRVWTLQPFQAPNWLDLRVGFLLSLTKATDDDDTTGLAETLTHEHGPVSDYSFIGVKDGSAIMPGQTGSVFAGYTNGFGPDSTGMKGDSKLVSSDEGVGTDNANFWRPANSNGSNYVFQVFDGIFPRGTGGSGNEPHFAQDASGAGGYASLLMLRLQRDDINAHSNLITVSIAKGTHNGNVLQTDTPTEALLQANLEAFPSTVTQIGPISFSVVPNALYLYWPFHNSRIRIHAMGILKAG